MRVGIVTYWFERGAAIVSRAYRDILVQAGQEVFIYARGGEQYAVGDSQWDHDYVTWGRPTWGPSTNVAWRHFKRWVERNRLDSLIFNEQQFWPPVVWARRELDVCLGTYIDYYTAKTVPFFQLFDFLLCNTRRHGGVFDWHPNAIYIPWGTDCECFQAHCELVAPGLVTFFHSAGMNPKRKGTLTALQAFTSLPSDRCRFVLHVQVPLERNRQIQEICRGDARISVVNETVGAPGLYHRGDVYVYPTILEGIGLTVPEALACGLPVITADCAPMNEFVQHGVNGWLVAPAEYRGRSDGYYWAECHCRVEDYAQAMAACVARVDSLTDMKRQARQSAERHHNWRINAADLPGRLERIVGGCRREQDLASLEAEALRAAPLPSYRAVLADVARCLGCFHRSPRVQKLILGTRLWWEGTSRLATGTNPP